MRWTGRSVRLQATHSTPREQPCHTSPPTPDFQVRCGCTYPITGRSTVVQIVEGVLHPGQATGQGQQEVHNFVQVPDEHPELVELIGLADALGNGLHLVPEGTVGLDVLQQALTGFPEHLKLAADAVDELLLWGTGLIGVTAPSPLPLWLHQANHIGPSAASNHRAYIRPGEGY